MKFTGKADWQHCRAVPKSYKAVGGRQLQLFVVKIPHGMPPGPIFGVPLLGTAIHLGENPLPGVKNLRKK